MSCDEMIFCEVQMKLRPSGLSAFRGVEAKPDVNLLASVGKGCRNTLEMVGFEGCTAYLASSASVWQFGG